MAIDFDSIHSSLEKAGINEKSPDRARLLELLSAGEKCPEFSSLIPGDLDIKAVARKRREGMPMEYALGIARFMGRIFCCTPDTLIPRADTSCLVESAVSAIDQLRDSGAGELEITEIGTGCGNIAIMVALLSEETSVHASDISEAAIKVARRNIEAYRLSSRITLRCGDMFEPLRELGQADIVICNPPYIPSGSLKNLDREIIDHEPVIALDAGTYGIDIFRRLIRDSIEFLRPGGILAFEFGERQEKFIRRLLEKSGGYRDISLHNYRGVPRAATAVRSRNEDTPGRKESSRE
ncbi:MAG: HemK family protein methyltransferase [Candidatus Latescibacteria bacterium]|nr:HemK family protein methyltransferase [bacterium]MBD3424338.1 HemK family protein methyltransferase [Candidatus Latescibacterota bacterium]